MSFKRTDGRAYDELRPIEARVGIIKRANGSASFRIGKTWAIAAVYGPRDLFPRFLQNPEEAILRCTYEMMPFAGIGERIKNPLSRRAIEISKITEMALKPALQLKAFPNAVVDVYIEIPEADAGSRCAGICAASMALADAGIPMKDLVAAVAVGKIGDTIIADLSYEEEAYEKAEVADIPIAMLPRTKEITLIQMDGIISKEQLKECLKLAEKKVREIYEIQKKALKERYEND